MAIKITTADMLGLNPKQAVFVIEYLKDFSPRRAAEAAGYNPDSGYKILEREDVQACINAAILKRREAADIDAEWALMEAVDNHMIARQQGNISASNTALKMVMMHSHVDAMAAEKVEVNTSKEIMERLMRGRKRMNKSDDDEVEESFM